MYSGIFTFLLSNAFAEEGVTNQTTIINNYATTCVFPNDMGQIIFLLAGPIIVFLLSHFFLHPILLKYFAKSYSPDKSRKGAYTADFILTTLGLFASSFWLTGCTPTEVVMLLVVLGLITGIYLALFITSKE